MQSSNSLRAIGVYEFYNCQTGEITSFKNVVCQNFFTQLFKRMKNEASDLYITKFATGTGVNPALKTDTALQTEVFRKNVSSVNYNLTKITIKTTLATSESNFVIKEVGIFTDTGIISRCNVNIDKNASTQYIVTYTLEVV